MFEAFILAGGRSSRMGTAKAAVTVGGVPMIERVAAAMTNAGASKVTVVSSRATADGFETVSDIYRGKGALGGIHSALKHSRCETVFIAACDLPFLTSELVRMLVDRFNEGSDDCVVPVQEDGNVQPLAAVYSRGRCLPVCERLLGEPGASIAVKALLDLVSPVYVGAEEIAGAGRSGLAFLNVNTPDDVESAEKLAADND